MRNKKLLTEKIFLLTWKRILIIIVSWFLVVILHNLFYMIFGFEEVVFFTFAIIFIPIYFVLSLGYTFYKNVKNRKDI